MKNRQKKNGGQSLLIHKCDGKTTDLNTNGYIKLYDSVVDTCVLKTEKFN